MIDRIFLRPDYHISRIIKGGWHLAGGHGHVDTNIAIDDMVKFVEAGITTFDCADIYTGVEEMIGLFIKRHKDAFRPGNLQPMQIHTKYVPDYDSLSTTSFKDTERIIDRSLRRLGVERLDMVQFAWWDYHVPRYVEVALHLKSLQKKGKIRFIGATNFDKDHLKEVVDADVDIVAHQVQYSVLDQRVESSLIPFHSENGVKTLCYGVIAGGFISDRYLGQEDPTPPLENRSLTKYRLIIEEFGGWQLYQDLLRSLRRIADKHQTAIAEIAAKYILDRPTVGAIIIGARNTRHLTRIQSLSGIHLDGDDNQQISNFINRSKGPQGPFYALERDKTGPHGSIMKYNLNKS